MINFSDDEKRFIESLEECRFATSHSNIPHVKPVSFLFTEGHIYIATDYETRSYKNILENSNVALSIDIYDPNNHRAILVQGKSEIIEQGKEFRLIFKKFFDKFQWVRSDPWEENEAPFIKIIPKTKISWGI
ncbi:MAG: pyridoxamine 5'-phosphate oxidase family protein [Nitrosopumilaceae archaeon]|nr:pyridoxamine 5'-phosphate oxidase family protein [Nitrosopumilaceae archaeon]NIU01168.1 pyridoxamine 5'-phosphate oxidase family protein [Nitrosopumilaceae archaeon]NIU87537.1 pyridoxamine 5'-phosphate oxidase family protein [Nitrosopumilaceae archaeon]NIV66002.1 pyridoxamine 5'-phosphate oxidase family protein [Nitrosopumilaceae archaeon]NIX61770.1 pyridoxamine 5'-phosphate oxidase family protein [Nitrosopumilaceae archaeon]